MLDMELQPQEPTTIPEASNWDRNTIVTRTMKDLIGRLKDLLLTFTPYMSSVIFYDEPTNLLLRRQAAIPAPTAAPIPSSQ